MFDLVSVLKFLHITAAIVWLGAAIFTFLAVRQGGDGAIAFLRVTEPTARVMYPATAVTIIVTGIWLTITDWSFGEPWIILGIVLFVATAVTGAGILAKNHTEIAKAVNAGQPESAYAPRLQQYLRVGPVDTLVLLAIIAVMVFKPGV